MKFKEGMFIKGIFGTARYKVVAVGKDVVTLQSSRSPDCYKTMNKKALEEYWEECEDYKCKRKR